MTQHHVTYCRTESFLKKLPDGQLSSKYMGLFCLRSILTVRLARSPPFSFVKTTSQLQKLRSYTHFRVIFKQLELKRVFRGFELSSFTQHMESGLLRKIDKDSATVVMKTRRKKNGR